MKFGLRLEGLWLDTRFPGPLEYILIAAHSPLKEYNSPLQQLPYTRCTFTCRAIRLGLIISTLEDIADHRSNGSFLHDLATRLPILLSHISCLFTLVLCKFNRLLQPLIMFPLWLGNMSFRGSPKFGSLYPYSKKPTPTNRNFATWGSL